MSAVNFATAVDNSTYQRFLNNTTIVNNLNNFDDDEKEDIYNVMVDFLNDISFEVESNTETLFAHVQFVREFVKVHIDPDNSPVENARLLPYYFNFLTGMHMTEDFTFHIDDETKQLWVNITIECKKFLNHEQVDTAFMIETFGHGYIDKLNMAMENIMNPFDDVLFEGEEDEWDLVEDNEDDEDW